MWLHKSRIGSSISLPGKTSVPFPQGRAPNVRFEMFNVFNNVNFTGLSTNITSSTFGQLTGQLDTTRSGGVLARTGQWAIRISF